MHNKYSTFAILMVIVFALASCDSTRVVSSWKSDDLSRQPFDNIVVLGLSSDLVAQNSLEQQVVSALEETQVSASTSGPAFNPNMDINDDMKAEVADKLTSMGYDGLLSVAVVNVSEDVDYVPGVGTYTPYAYPYYGTYWSYYGYYAPQVYSPGYYTTDVVYTIEAHLYDVNTEELVWAARSKTVNPNTIGQFAENYAETIADQLIEDNVVQPTNNENTN